MKRLITLITLGSVLFTGAVSARTDTPVRNRDGQESTENFGIPRALRANEGIQTCVADYRIARQAFATEMQQLRLRLAAASDENKDAVKQQIREQLKAHRDAQTEFRKKVRELVRELRQERFADTGNGG